MNDFLSTMKKTYLSLSRVSRTNISTIFLNKMKLFQCSEDPFKVLLEELQINRQMRALGIVRIAVLKKKIIARYTTVDIRLTS